MPDHPDREQLAAYQAGEVDRRERIDVQAHLDGCPGCASVVASVEQARHGLALLEEPDLPPGLHDRLAAAIADERATQALPDRPAPWYRPAPGGGRPADGRARQRPTPWYRRPVAWGAAAALLLAALIVPLLDRTGGLDTTAGGAGGATAVHAPQEADQARGTAAATAPPVLALPGEVSAATVRSALASDRRAQQALGSTSSGARSGGAAAPDDAQDRAAPPPGTTPQSPAEGYESGRVPAQRTKTDLQPCLPAATAAADPTTTPLAAAFFIEGTYQGRPATVLVTTSQTQPNQVDLWVFPRDDCSSPPLATERVR